MLFTNWEVRTGKNICQRSQKFPSPVDQGLFMRPIANIFEYKPTQNGK